MKAFKFFSSVITVLLGLLYLFFAFSVSCMFDFLPWHDEQGYYMLSLVIAWLPLCVLSLVQIVVLLAAKKFEKPTAMLLCLNALYIPVIFLLGFGEFSFGVYQTIGVIGIITMIAYMVIFIKKLKGKAPQKAKK